MSDRDNEPTDLFDAICRLDDLAEWLKAAGYDAEGQAIAAISDELKNCIVLSVSPEARA